MHCTLDPGPGIRRRRQRHRPLLVLLLIPFAMYFLLIRPQRKRMKDAARCSRSLGVGDEVITSSGVYGFITGEEDDLFWLEIDDDVQIRIAKAAIQGKAGPAKDESKRRRQRRRRGRHG